ncbi:MAG: radical SAM protein [Actinobacteria bacterium]|nr:radical SAM protein [Actinomycetota bacterium]
MPIKHVPEAEKQERGDLSWLRRLPQPEPMPNAAAYRRERWLALATSPRRLLNYVKYTRSSRRSARVHYLPIKLDIENVSRCNFHCTMCQVSAWPKFKRAEDMTFEDFKRLIDQQYGLVEIKLQGMGEPTLGRETFYRMIRYARSKHIWVRTVTNASLLHVNDNYRKIIDAGTNEVQISIDGATKSTFEKIRRGSNFELVVKNCTMINRYCQEQGLRRTKMWVVVQRDNVGELLPLADLCAEMGFTSLVYSLNLTDWGQERWREANSEATVEREVTLELVKKVITRCEDRGIRVGFWNITSKYSARDVRKLCPWPFERAYVSSDMRIVPCCMLANPDVSELGSARDFSTQWQAETYVEFRQAHLDGCVPKVCRGCYEDEDHSPRC